MNLTQNTKLTYLIFFKSTKPAKNAVPATKIPIIPLQIAPVPKVSVLALFPKTTTIKNINIRYYFSMLTGCWNNTWVYITSDKCWSYRGCKFRKINGRLQF